MTISHDARKRFCQTYLRTLDPQYAARIAGAEDGFALLRDPKVRKALERMREASAAQITREDAVRRMGELAFGRANDAAALALAAPADRTDVAELDLSAVSELKVSEKGVEVRFIDRVRALEVLCTLLGGSADDAADFFRALEDAAGPEGEG